jgi:hypothetical protein
MLKESESLFMNLHVDAQDAHDVQQLTIRLELLSEGMYEADLALVAAVGRATVEGLEQDDRYTVQPVPTGERGGDFLVQVLTFLEALPADVWTHKTVIERVMTDAGTLVGICTGVVPLIRRVFQAHKQQEAKKHGVHQAFKMTLEIDGHAITLEAQDVEGAEAGLKTAARFYEQHPDAAKKITPRSHVKVKGKLPAQPQRKRR